MQSQEPVVAFARAVETDDRPLTEAKVRKKKTIRTCITAEVLVRKRQIAFVRAPPPTRL